MGWLKESRKGIKGKNIAEIAKKAGAMWKSLSADKKKSFEDRASKAKAEYAAYIAKVKGTEAFTTYKTELAAAKNNKLKRSVKTAMHKVKMDDKLKRPAPAYTLWFKDTRKTLKGTFSEVGKKAGTMWKSLPADKKKVYTDRAEEAKKKYDAFVATSKGAAALKTYRDAIAKARAPLTKNSDAVKAKKAAAKVKAKAKREKAKAKAAAKKGKAQALKEKAKARAAAAKEKAKAKAAKKAKAKAKAAAKAKAKAAKKEKAKATAAAKAKAKAAKKEKAKAKAAAMKAAMKGAMKKAKAMKAPMKAAMKTTKKVVKKLVESVPDVVSILTMMLVGGISCGGIALAVLHFRRSVSSPIEEALLV